jgi:hypothetical protein
MKLYNLFKEVIFEESQKRIRLLTEGVDVDSVRAAIDGMYMVNVKYRPEEDNVVSNRYVAVYNLGKTKSGNDAIRVYQVSGGNRKQADWKTFRLDRVEGWQPTKMRWYNPVSDYDASIPKYQIGRDKTMSSVNKFVDPTKFGNPRNMPAKKQGTTIEPSVSTSTSSKTEPEVDTTNMIKIPEPEPDDDFIPEPNSPEEPEQKQVSEPKVKVPQSNTPRKVNTTIPKPNDDESEYEEEDVDDENNENNQ